jgi:hypothetical protein
VQYERRNEIRSDRRGAAEHEPGPDARLPIVVTETSRSATGILDVLQVWQLPAATDTVARTSKFRLCVRVPQNLAGRDFVVGDLHGHRFLLEHLRRLRSLLGGSEIAPCERGFRIFEPSAARRVPANSGSRSGPDRPGRLRA